MTLVAATLWGAAARVARKIARLEIIAVMFN